MGGSSTGKTRACWEALQLLRDQEPGWRLWHPIDPSRPDAALRELPGIGPRTVVSLNEAQFYLDAAGSELGERVAAGLRELLRDPGRGPVLVLATLWPRFWDTLTARPAAPTRAPRRGSCCPARTSQAAASSSSRWAPAARRAYARAAQRRSPPAPAAGHRPRAPASPPAVTAAAAVTVSWSPAMPRMVTTGTDRTG